jgi:hypothetical protein
MLVDEVIEIIWPMSESGTKRIPANRFLNQDCAFVLGLESMLLRDPPQNPFSTWGNSGIVPHEGTGNQLSRNA